MNEKSIARERNWIVALGTAADAPENLRLEAIRKIGTFSDENALMLLIQVALDRTVPSAIRSEALLTLNGRPLESPESLAGLVSDEDTDVAIEALRALKPYVSVPAIRKQILNPPNGSLPVGPRIELATQMRKL